MIIHPTHWIIVCSILAILLLERLAVTWLTTREWGREWVKRSKILHPNSISLVRIPMGAVAAGLAARGMWTAGILWFAFWMITDLTDGTIARNCDLVTESGKWLDPLSDKCMYFPVLVFFAIPGVLRTSLPIPWIIALLTIDAVGQASRLFTTKKAANYFGKGKTALITVLLSVAGLNQIEPLWFVSEQFLYLLTVSCTLLAFMSFYCKVIPDQWYANTLTLANFLCGIGSLYGIYIGRPLAGFVLVFLGQFFDLFDGRLARKFGSTRHGAIFDDIADGTSFGVAIGYLIYDCLGDGVPLPVRVGIVAIYVGCIVYRLYRFLHPQTPLPRGIFEGIPSPAGAMLSGSGALLFSADYPWVTVVIVLAASSLMICRTRYKHFGQHIWPGFPRTVKLLLCILFLIFIDIAISHRSYAVAFSAYCFLMSLLYLVLGKDWGKNSDDAEAEASE